MGMPTRAILLAAAFAAAVAVSAAEPPDQQDVLRRMQELKTRTAADAAGQSAQKPYVLLRRFVCEKSGAKPEDLDKDLEEARQVFARCRLNVRAAPPETIPSDYGAAAACQLGDDRGSKTLTPDHISLFSRYHWPKESLSVFYLSFRAGPNGPTTAGTSFPADYIRQAKDDDPRARVAIGAVVVFSGARAFTGSRFVLPHEMGHVLLNDSAHRPERGNLMREWDSGGTLDAAQCLTIRASPFVRRD